MTPKERENRIDNEIIVDAYEDGEVNMSWFYYFNDHLAFPVSAVAKLKKRNGQFERVEVMLVEVCLEGENEPKFGFVLTMKGYIFPISLKDIVSVDTSDENREMLNDWLFWKGLKPL